MFVMLQIYFDWFGYLPMYVICLPFFTHVQWKCVKKHRVFYSQAFLVFARITENLWQQYLSKVELQNSKSNHLCTKKQTRQIICARKSVRTWKLFLKFEIKTVKRMVIRVHVKIVQMKIKLFCLNSNCKRNHWTHSLILQRRVTLLSDVHQYYH